MARPPPPGYSEALGLPSAGRAYERYIPPAADAAAHQAVHHNECPVCFESMHSEPSGVFANGSGKRVCPHFFHHRCATDLCQRGNQKCPLCRAPFAKVLNVPKLESDPQAWFKVVDLNGDGGLSKDEIKFVLLAQIPIDEVVLDEELNRNFKRWDKNKDGVIRYDELMDSNGVIAYLKAKAARQPTAVPDIKVNKDAWYKHYDENNNGTLQREEVVRGLIQTFKMGHDAQRMDQIRGTVEAVWPIFDTDGSGSIEREEFLKAGDGLADTIIATLR